MLSKMEAPSPSLEKQVVPERARAVADPVFSEHLLMVTVNREHYLPLLGGSPSVWCTNCDDAIRKFLDGKQNISSLICAEPKFSDHNAIELIDWRMSRLPPSIAIPFLILSNAFKNLTTTRPNFAAGSTILILDSQDIFRRKIKSFFRQATVVQVKTLEGCDPYLLQPTPKASLIFADHSLVPEDNVSSFVQKVGPIPLIVTIDSIQAFSFQKFLLMNPTACVSKPFDEVRHARFLKMI